MKPVPNRLPELIERLQAAGLMPPIRSVEMIGGGIIRLIATATLDPELRAPLADAMGSTRWKLVEARDDRAAGVDFRASPD